MRMMKTLWLLGAATLALGLSGCGGGSSTQPAAPAAALTPPAGGDEIPAPVPGHLGAGGVMVEISHDGSTAGAAFMKGETVWNRDAADGEAAIDITGEVWNGFAVQNLDTAPTERIVAYTNIKAPEAELFHTVKGPAPYMVADETVAPDSDTRAFLPQAGSLYTFRDDADEEGNQRTFIGQLGGTMGTFTCTMDPCNLVRGQDAEDDEATWTLSDGWTFTADAGENIDVPDANYLAFGYWNKIDTERTLADFVPFYYGSMPYSGNVQALSGSATYTGNAAGGYEHNTYNAQTGEAVPTYGHFTAAVRLDAFFGGEDGMSTIDGLVNAFTVSGSENVETWSVPLMRTEVTGQTFEGDTTGGNWSGAFFGPSDEGQLPSGVAGQFSATVGTGGVVGAYGGATR